MDGECLTHPSSNISGVSTVSVPCLQARTDALPCAPLARRVPRCNGLPRPPRTCVSCLIVGLVSGKSPQEVYTMWNTKILEVIKFEMTFWPLWGGMTCAMRPPLDSAETSTTSLLPL